jgi:hypothetical protein
LGRTEVLAKQFTSDSPEGAYLQYRSLEAIAGVYLAEGAAAEARAAYLQSGATLERYVLSFRTASPERRADGDESTVAGMFGNLSFTYLRAGSFAKSMEAAERGLGLEPQAGWIEANLAHGFLLTGKEDEARLRYMKVRKNELGGRSLVEVTAEDFTILKNLGFEHPQMDAILKQMAQP